MHWPKLLVLMKFETEDQSLVFVWIYGLLRVNSIILFKISLFVIFLIDIELLQLSAKWGYDNKTLRLIFLLPT